MKAVQLKAYLTPKQIQLFGEWTRSLTYLWNLAVSITQEEKQRIWRDKGSKAALGFKGKDKLDLSLAGNTPEVWKLKKVYPIFEGLTEAEKLERRNNNELALGCDIAYYNKQKEYIMAVPIRPHLPEKLDKKLYDQIFTNKWLKDSFLPPYQVAELLKVHSKLRQGMIQMQFDTARKNHLAGHTRQLKFKSVHRDPISFLSNQQTNMIKLYPERHVVVPFGAEFGEISFRGLHERHKGLSPRNATLTQKADGFYLSLTFDIPEEPLQPVDKPVGIDPGVKVFLALSDGTKIGNNAASEEDIAALLRRRDRLQKQLSRQELRSSNWRKTQGKLARVHKHLADIRKTYSHKVSSRIVDEYDEIYLEDTNLRNMTRKAKPILNEEGSGYKRNNKKQKAGLNRAILNQGIGQVREMIKTKAISKGRFFDVVEAKDTSITCSVCGYKDKENRPSQELFQCLSCGHTENADINASKVILSKGLQNKECLSYNDKISYF